MLHYQLKNSPQENPIISEYSNQLRTTLLQKEQRKKIIYKQKLYYYSSY